MNVTDLRAKNERLTALINAPEVDLADVVESVYPGETA